MGPFARTSMNLSRAILPCLLDFPVVITSARRNNIHLTFRWASTWASLFRFIRSRKLSNSFGRAWRFRFHRRYSPDSGEFQHSKNGHFRRSSRTHSRPINFPRRRAISEIRRNSQRSDSQLHAIV